MEIKRSYNIDLAKVIAYIGVVFLHVVGEATNSGYSGPVLSQIMYNLGTIAVPIFFVVNGYLVLGKKSVTYSYSNNKILNILGVILCWNIIYSILFYLAKHQVKNPIQLSWESLLQKGVFPQFWFLGSLMICYLLLPILSNIWHKNFRIFIVIFTICVLISLCLDFRNILTGGSPIQRDVIQTFRLWTWLMYYMLGGILRRIANDKKLPAINPIICGFFIIGMLVYEFFIKYRYGMGFAEYNYDNLIIVLTVTLVFIVILNLKIPNQVNNKILFLSQNGFGVYIVHLLFLKVIEKVLDLSNLWLNLVGLIMVLVLSYSLTYLVSKIRYIRKLVFR